MQLRLISNSAPVSTHKANIGPGTSLNSHAWQASAATLPETDPNAEVNENPTKPNPAKPNHKPDQTKQKQKHSNHQAVQFAVWNVCHLI